MAFPDYSSTAKTGTAQIPNSRGGGIIPTAYAKFILALRRKKPAERWPMLQRGQGP